MLLYYLNLSLMLLNENYKKCREIINKNKNDTYFLINYLVREINCI